MALGIAFGDCHDGSLLRPKEFDCGILGSFSSLSTCQHDALSDACFDVAPSVARSTGTHARPSGEGVRDRLERIRAVFGTVRVGCANILVKSPTPIGARQPISHPFSARTCPCMR